MHLDDLVAAGAPALGLGTRGHRATLRDTDVGAAERAVAIAIERGCPLVECAPAWGESERIVGAAVRALRARDRVVVATGFAGRRGWPPAVGAVEAAIEASLRATRLEALPLYWLDGWDDDWLEAPHWVDLRGALDARVRAGDLRAWGVGVPAPAAATRVVEAGAAAIATRWSLFDRRADAALLPAARAAKLPVVARAPLAEGALTGALHPTAAWRPGDERATWGPRLTAIVPDLAALAALTRWLPPAAATTDAGRQRLDGLRRHPEVVHATLAELAVAAARAQPGVAAVVIGARAPDHAAAWWPTPPPPLPTAIAAALAAQPWGEAWYRRRDER